MNSILTLAMKDLRLLFREKAALFFTLGFPVLFAVFFGAVFAGGGGGGGIDVVGVDSDKTATSAALMQRLAQAPELNLVTKTAGESPREFTPDEAKELVRRGKRTAAIIIPEGYGDESKSVFWGNGSGGGGGRAIDLAVDPSRKADAGMLEGVLTRYAFEQFGKVFSDPGAMRAEMERSRRLLSEDTEIDPVSRALLGGMFASIDAVAAGTQQPAAGGEGAGGFQGFNPVEIRKVDVAVAKSGPTNSYALTFAQAILWGVAGCAATFGISLVVERTKGTLVRLRTAPLSWGQVLGGKALACFIATLIVEVMLVLLARVVFKVIPASMPMLALALVCVAMCFVGVMMLLSVLGRSESSAGSIGWAVILVFMMIGGGMVPTFAMPRWMQQISDFSPFKWGILAVEGGLWRGFTPGEMLLPCAILVGVGVVGWLVGVRLFRAMEPA